MERFFLVCVSVPLVARDVTTTLEQLGLGVPLVATSNDEALDLVGRLDAKATLTHALVQVAPEAYAASALRSALDRLGAKVILLHDDPPAADPAPVFPVLTPPFFTEDLEGAIAALRPPPL